jgi:FkbM family methyltransferase
VNVRAIARPIKSHYDAWKCWKKSRDEIGVLPVLCDKKRDALDIGANGGNMAYFIRRHAHFVHVFEPLRHLAEHLRKRFPSRIAVYQMALSASDGEAELATPVANGLPLFGLSSLQLPEKKANGSGPAGATEIRRERVPLRRLDDVFSGDAAFVKIDVEGHEVDVLKGGKKTIARCRPTLLIEASERVYPGSVAPLRSFMEGLNYDGWFIESGALRSIEEFTPANVSEVSLTQLADRNYLAKAQKYISDFIWLPAERSSEIRHRITAVLSR